MSRRMIRIALPPIAAGAVVLLIGFLGALAGIPWLFASLGPSAVLQASMPMMRMSRPYNVAVGHLIALGTGFFAVYITGAVHAPPYTVLHPIVLTRVWAAGIAITLAVACELAAKAQHAPAASTSLLVALGIVTPSWRGAFVFVCGILLVTVLGEGVRRLSRSVRTT